MRYERHEKKKKRRPKKSFYVLLLVLAAIIAYVFFQYKAGVSKSIGETNVKQEVYEFKGKKDQYGGTNILLLGQDAKGDGKSRADTIMIAHYNQDKGSYKLTSIMRDTYVEIPGHEKGKINVAFALGGPELIRKTIKQNFDIDLQYYALIDYDGFVHLIDEAFPKGVEVNVEKRMSENIGMTIEPGVQRLDGKHLLGYVRFRHDAVGDFGRVKRQQQVIKEVGTQLSSVKTIPKLPKLVGVVAPYVNTNIDKKDTIFMAKDFLSENREPLETFRIPVDGSFSDQRISGIGAVLDIDLEKNKQALHEFLTQ